MDTYRDPDPDGMQETTLNISFLLAPDEDVEPTAADGEATRSARTAPASTLA